MRSALVLSSVALVMLVAGCLGTTPGMAEPPTPVAEPAGAPASPAWPPVEGALLRPGIQVGLAKPGVVVVLEVDQVPVSDCTANFLFATRDNATLYLGTAAHCVDHLAVGDPYPLLEGRFTATVAYVSFHALTERGEGGEDTFRANDLALLAIHPEDRAHAHPALLHFGGPTAVAEPAETAVGDRVLVYGNSDLRQGQAGLAPRDGCVTRANATNTVFRSIQPVVSGDSGSPALSGDGAALGIVSRIGNLEEGNGLLTNLAPALEYARDAAGLDVVLQTWPLLTPEAGPSAPC